MEVWMDFQRPTRTTSCGNAADCQVWATHCGQGRPFRKTCQPSIWKRPATLVRQCTVVPEWGPVADIFAFATVEDWRDPNFCGQRYTWPVHREASPSEGPTLPLDADGGLDAVVALISRVEQTLCERERRIPPHRPDYKQFELGRPPDVEACSPFKVGAAIALHPERQGEIRALLNTVCVG